MTKKGVMKNNQVCQIHTHSSNGVGLFNWKLGQGGFLEDLMVIGK